MNTNLKTFLFIVGALVVAYIVIALGEKGIEKMKVMQARKAQAAAAPPATPAADGGDTTND